MWSDSDSSSDDSDDDLLSKRAVAAKKPTPKKLHVDEARTAFSYCWKCIKYAVALHWVFMEAMASSRRASSPALSLILLNPCSLKRFLAKEKARTIEKLLSAPLLKFTTSPPSPSLIYKSICFRIAWKVLTCSSWRPLTRVLVVAL